MDAPDSSRRDSEETCVADAPPTSRPKKGPTARRASHVSEHTLQRVPTALDEEDGAAAGALLTRRRSSVREAMGKATASLTGWMKERRTSSSSSSSASRPSRTRSHSSGGSSPWLPKIASDEVIETVIKSAGTRAYNQAYGSLDPKEFEAMLTKHAKLAGRIYQEELNGDREGIMGEKAEWQKQSR